MVQKVQNDCSNNDYLNPYTNSIASEDIVTRYHAFIKLLLQNTEYQRTFSESRSLRGSIAFFLDTNKQTDPEKIILNSTVQKIAEIFQNFQYRNQAYIESTRLLNNLIKEMYLSVLQGRLLTATNFQEAQFYQQAIQDCENIQAINRILETNQNAVVICGVHESLEPKWFKEISIRDKWLP